ncbi:MAG: hypothetical protein QM768_16600 [Agriterribacter sp.]
MDNSGCCNDHLEFVKLENEQNFVATIHYKLPSVKPMLPELKNINLVVSTFHSPAGVFNNNAPPRKSSRPVSIMQCIFRI